jgi:hypothetical protein
MPRFRYLGNKVANNVAGITWLPGDEKDVLDEYAEMLRMWPDTWAEVAQRVDTNRLRFVGRHHPFGNLTSASGSDIGGTSRKRMKSIGPITRLASLHLAHGLGVGSIGSCEDSTNSLRRFAATKLAYEFDSTYTFDSLNGRTTFVVDPNAGAVLTDESVYLSAATNSWCVST